jgi:hypothetical protein
MQALLYRFGQGTYYKVSQSGQFVTIMPHFCKDSPNVFTFEVPWNHVVEHELFVNGTGI